MTDRVAVVLAGGYSTRFADGDKTVAELGGRPLIVHAVDSVQEVVDTVVVSCRDEQMPQFRRILDSVTYRPDRQDDQGPLAGLVDSLGAVERCQVALATADMPHVPPALFGDLFARLEQGEQRAVAISDEGFVQPAPAVFDREALTEAVTARRAAEDRRLRSVFEGLSVATMERAAVENRYGSATLADVNTVEDIS